MRFTRNLRGAIFFLSHMRISFFFFFLQMSQCHFNFVLIDIKLSHIYTAPKFIITPDISKSKITKLVRILRFFSIKSIKLEAFYGT